MAFEVIALGKQAAAGTAAANALKLQATRIRYGPGALVYRGEPEMGAGLYSGGAAAILRYLPVFSIDFIPRLGTLVSIFELMGFDITATSANPEEHTLEPVTSMTNWDPFTLVMGELTTPTTNHERQVDAYGARLTLEFRSGQIGRATMEGFALTQNFGTATLTAEPGDFTPSPAAETASGKRTVAGVADQCLLDFNIVIENTFDVDSQCLGKPTLTSLTCTAKQATFGGTLKTTQGSSLWKGILYGATGATAPTGGVLQALLNMQLETGANLPGEAVPGYLEVNAASAFHLPVDGVVESTVGQVTRLPFLAYTPNGTLPSIKILNGVAVSTYAAS